MSLKNRRPDSDAVTQSVVRRIRSMSSQEALSYLSYRTPGVPEIDTTGQLAEPPRRPAAKSKQRKAAA
jgi:hypothetical protein